VIAGTTVADPPFTFDFTAYTGFGVVSSSATIESNLQWVHSTTSGVASQLVKIPLNCDVGAFFTVVANAATVTSCSMRAFALPLGAIGPATPGPRNWVKKVDGSIDYDAMKHRENEIRSANGEEVKCDCAYCQNGDDIVGDFVDGQSWGEKFIPDDSKVETPKLKLEIDLVAPLVTKEKSGDSTPVKVDVAELVWDTAQERIVPGPILATSALVRIPKQQFKPEFVRVGEAKKPGPGDKALRADHIPVHHCGKYTAFLSGNPYRGTVPTKFAHTLVQSSAEALRARRAIHTGKLVAVLQPRQVLAKQKKVSSTSQLLPSRPNWQPAKRSRKASKKNSRKPSKKRSVKPSKAKEDVLHSSVNNGKGKKKKKKKKKKVTLRSSLKSSKK